MNEFGIALLWCTIQVTVVTLAAAVIDVACRRRSRPSGSVIVLTSLMLVIGLSLFAFSPWPNWSEVSERLAADEAPASAIETTPAPTSDTSNEVASAPPTEAEPAIAEAPDEAAVAAAFWNTLVAEIQHPKSTVDRSTWRWPAVLASLFLAGLGIGVVRLIWGLLGVGAYRRRSAVIEDSALRELVDVLSAELGCRRSIELRESTEIITAATVGWRRPIVLLPTDWRTWNVEQRRAVLAHEIAHIRRNDFLAWVCAQVGLILHFYHPLVHWLTSRLRLEQELAADADAALLAGGRQAYLKTLAAMALKQPDKPLGWPARTFLPTRRTFLRRIEMLRDAKKLTTRVSALGRVTAVACLLMAGVLAAGFRVGVEDAAAAAAEAAVVKKDKKAGKRQPLSTAWTPANTAMIYTARVRELVNRKDLTPIRPLVDELAGKSVATLPQISTISMVGVFQGKRHRTLMILRTAEDTFESGQQDLQIPRGWSNWFAGGKKSETISHGDHVCFEFETVRGPMRFCCFADARTVLFADDVDVLKSALDAGNRGAAGGAWLEKWDALAGGDAAIAMNFDRLRDEINREMPPGGIGPMMQAFAPIWNNAHGGLLGVSLGKKPSVNLIFNCADDPKAKQVKEVVGASFVLLRSMLENARQQALASGGSNLSSDRKVAASLIEQGEALLRSAKVKQKGKLVTVSASVNADLPALIATLTPAIQEAREAARRAQAKNNLKQFGLAMHNFHDTYKSFPPAVVLGPDGKTPHSWRIELLPFLAQKALYDQYKMDEPWDSENNKEVLAQMPAVFRNPNAPAGTTNSSYFLLTGDGAVFSGVAAAARDKGTKFQEIRDGMSKTIMIVESKQNIPWTKPVDLPYTKDGKIPKLGGFHREGYHAALCDGAVRFISDSLDEKVLRGLISKAGREVVDLSQPASRRRPLVIEEDRPLKPR